MKFYLVQAFSKLSTLEWILFAVLIAIFVTALTVALRMKENESFTTHENVRALVYAAICIALSFVLSYLRLFRMPQGGSITPASMLPVMVYAYWYGPRKGLLAALAYSFLQFFQDPVISYGLIQILLDYILAFTALGLVGFFPKRLPLGVLCAGIVRILCHFLSGVLFFAEYAPEGSSAVLYSLGYQFASVGPDALICLVIVCIPAVRRVIERLSPIKKPKAA